MDKSKILKTLYSRLLDEFGHQGWWPVTPVGSCYGDIPRPIYGLTAKNDKQKLEIFFGAILTQNTSWKNVEKSIIELNKKQLIDINKIIKIKHEELAEIIKSSGYFNQ